jgi:putative membrane protein
MIIGAAILSLAVAQVSAQTAAKSRTSKSATHRSAKHAAAPDTTAKGFLTEAAVGGMAEVDLGRLASSKASNPDVKAFAEKMVSDHSKADDEVKDLAARKNITLPTDLDAKHKAEHDRLAALSGAAFDRAYVNSMLKDHRKDVAEFKQESTMNQDPDVKAWAAKTVPTLEDHLKQVQTLSKTVAPKAARAGRTSHTGRTTKTPS